VETLIDYSANMSPATSPRFATDGFITLLLTEARGFSLGRSTFDCQKVAIRSNPQADALSFHHEGRPHRKVRVG
jgi:hypothetical protein